ncbi:MAG TPA: methyltransferase domain-containing protein [Mycobacteriales bacterium]|nr:methyltransferase domain-containing protein [Mycobacteriales bacterium]
MTAPLQRPRNDPGQYDDLVADWWEPRGRFAMLHWIAAARARLIPPPQGAGSVLVDIACGGGLLAPHLAGSGHRHIGVDVSTTALEVARSRGVLAVRGNALALPLRDACADVVVAGEILEHVTDLDAAVAEACRVLRPGGTLVIDTIAATWWGRFSSITVGEKMPAGPPARLHDGALFVDRDRLQRVAADHGVRLTLTGLRPAALDYARWLVRLRRDVRMLSTRSTAGLFQAVGRKGTGA